MRKGLIFIFLILIATVLTGTSFIASAEARLETREATLLGVNLVSDSYYLFHTLEYGTINVNVEYAKLGFKIDSGLKGSAKLVINIDRLWGSSIGSIGGSIISVIVIFKDREQYREYFGGLIAR